MVKKMLQATPMPEDVSGGILLISLAATFMSMSPVIALIQYFVY